MSFDGKVVIITGASSGIGAETAIRFSEEGAKVVLCGRSLEGLHKTADQCEKSSFIIIQGDVTIEEDNAKIIDETIEKFNKIDILVNNAGIVEVGSIENTSLEQYDLVMNTNVRSLYHLTMLCVPHLIKTQGNVVNVSSVNGIRSFPGVLAYNMSKAAVDQFTRCVALELACKNVRVNSVNPGVIITEIHKRSGMSDDQYQSFLEHSKQTHALGRPGSVKEVASAILFLANDSTSSFVTGISLPVDGGRHAMCPR